MAVIKTIRNYSGIAIFFIAVSILAFIAADLIIPGGAGGQQQLFVGSINGIKIPREEFENQVNEIEYNYRLGNQQASIDDQLRQSFREQAWSNLVFKYAYTDFYKELALAVSDKELQDMVQGDSLFIHPWIRQQFTNQQTNQFDKELVIRYLKQYNQMPPQQRQQWENFEKELYKERLRSKYVDLLRLSSYVTEAEAERQYQSQTAKVNVKYLYVPYTSLVDSLYKSKITDDLLSKKLKENKDKYKAEETRSLEYIVFDVFPSKQDSLSFQQDLKQLAQDFKKAPNDSSFASLNSDTPEPVQFQPVGQVPTILFDKHPTLEKAKVYGPYPDNNAYKIFKVIDIKEDSLAYVRARHILFQADETASEELKAEARKKANDILQQIKDGADFAEMARKYGTDGTAQKGGDLGFFANNGQMVAPFEKAAFAQEGTGLVPNLVETKFGYHILDITAAKTKNTYKIATITRTLDPSEETRDGVLLKAEELRSKSENADDLRAEIAKNPRLILEKAEKLPTSASNIGNITGAREVIRWAFNDASLNQVSDVFEIADQNKYIIATLTAKTKKDESSVEIFRTELEQEVLTDIKAKEIISKLNLKAKTLEEMAKAYGTSAQVGTANDLLLNSAVLQNAGFSPKAIGQAFGLQKGKRTQAIQDESGVIIVEVLSTTPAPKIADYSQYKDQLVQNNSQRVQYLTDQALRKAANIVDERYKYY